MDNWWTWASSTFELGTGVFMKVQQWSAWIRPEKKILFRNKHSAIATKGNLTWSQPWTVKADHLESQETQNHGYNVPAYSWSVLKFPSTLKHSDFYIYVLSPTIPNPLSLKEENNFSCLNPPEHFLELWKNCVMTDWIRMIISCFLLPAKPVHSQPWADPIAPSLPWHQPQRSSFGNHTLALSSNLTTKVQCYL